VALALGLLAGNLFKPGAGFEGSPFEDAAGQAKESIAEAGEAGSGIVGFITEDLLPTSFVQPFADNEILKVLVLAILVAAAISGLAPAVRERVVGGFETASKIVFGVICIIMWAAPLGAFGGMAFTVAQFGGGALKNLGMLLLTFWGTAAVFVLCVLGLVARLNGAGLVPLTASLQAFGGTFFSPESIAVGIALVVGIDRMMSEGRALTNAIGNGVATMVVARWHGELDEERFQKVLDKPSLADPDLEDETAPTPSPPPSRARGGRQNRSPREPAA